MTFTDEEFKYIESLEYKNRLLMLALKEAGKYARENISAFLPEEIEYVSAIVGGAEDVDGKRFIQIWLAKASEKLK